MADLTQKIPVNIEEDEAVVHGLRHESARQRYGGRGNSDPRRRADHGNLDVFHRRKGDQEHFFQEQNLLISCSPVKKTHCRGSCYCRPFGVRLNLLVIRIILFAPRWNSYGTRSIETVYPSSRNVLAMGDT